MENVINCFCEYHENYICSWEKDLDDLRTNNVSWQEEPKYDIYHHENRNKRKYKNIFEGKAMGGRKK